MKAGSFNSVSDSDEQNQNLNKKSKLREICNYLKKPFKKTKKYVEGQDYSSGEDGSDFVLPFFDLSLEDKELRLRYLWEKTFLKAKGANHILAKFGDLNKKIYLYGA